MAKLPRYDAKPVMTEFSIDRLTDDSWMTPIGTADANVAERIYGDGVLVGTTTSDASDNRSFTTPELPDDTDSFTAETGKGSLTQTSDRFVIEIDSLTPAHGIGSATAAESALKLIGADDTPHAMLAYPQAGDGLVVNAAGLPAGIAADAAATPARIILTGSATFAGSAVAITDPAPDAADDTATAQMDTTVTTGTVLANEVQGSTTPTVFETRVAAAGDDVEERATGSMSLSSSDLELTFDGSLQQTVGVRFTGIDIPQGAIIVGAYIQFQADEVKTGTASLLIQGEDRDDAGAFTAVKFNVSSRTRTDASAAWEPADWTTRGEAGLAQRTTDLSAIVQEIVDRSGWAALNDMVFLITGTGTRTAKSYEGSATGAPLLHIEYLLPGPVSDPVVFNTPPDADSVANQIGELAAAGTAVGITASATDPDAGSTITYSIDDPRFAINANTGVITRSANGTLDFETGTSITLAVTATSSDRSTATQTFTLNVLDSPEAVAFNTPPDADAAANRIADNAAAGTVVGITASATDPDAGSTVTYSVDDSRFAIDPNTGVITRSGTGTLDFETEPSVTLAVTATSSDGSTANEDFSVSVTVTGSTTPMVFETRVAAAGDDVEERATGSMSLSSSDLELTFDGSLQQTVGVRFTGIDIPQGAIIVGAYIQFQADEVKTGTASLLIQGEDRDDAGAFTAVKFNVSSRTRTDASAAWEPADWTTRGEAGLAQRTTDLSAIVQEIVDRSGWAALNDMVFLITGTGTRTAKSYEGSATGAPLLHIEYLLPGPVSDPVVFNTPPDADSVANQIGELAAAGTAVGITASATDPDAGSTITYSIDDPRFAINANTGVITRSANGTLDFETGTSITLAVTATSSDRSTATQTFTLNVLDSPEAVAFNTPPDADAAANRIAGNAAAGTVVGITASATDPDAGSTVTYSVDDSRFAIDPNTGVITRSGTGTLDFETEPSVTLAVTATSSDGSTANEDFSVSVTVTGSTTPMVFETRVAAAGDDVEERATGSMSLSSSDLELTFDGSLQQTVGVRFTGIDIPQGAIIVGAYIQFQADEVKTGTASLLIQGEDRDDAGAFTAVKFNVSSRTRTDASAAWEPADWTTRGEAGLAQRTTDLSAIVQEIVDRSGWAALNDMVFLITGTGTRTAKSYEGSATGAPLLHIEYLLPGPVSDPVVFNTPPDADSVANQIGELAAAGTAVGITASATDPDAGSTITYSIDDPRFAINANTGVITRSANGTLDFETGTSITLAVTATSSDRSTATQTFTLNVLDSPEAVAFNTPPDADAAANRIAGNAAAGTVVGITASATDPDAGSTVTYSVDDSRFAIDPNTGVITRSGTGTLDFETEPSVTLAVTATSSDGSTDAQAFTVNLVPAADQILFRFAVFGDYGDTEPSGERAVAALVDSWTVDFILTVGDNAYGSIAFDDAVGQHYADYIGNYTGSHGSGSTINRFFPTLGNREYSDNSAGLNGGIDIYLAYFTLPDNERYYDFQAGSVHFFALNSNSQEPDGDSASSLQAQWLEAALAASDATFNVTYFHHTPYTPPGGDTDMRWNFEALGVDAVFAGHDHEYFRVMRDDNEDGVDIPYVTTGLGGAGNSPPNVGANLVTVTDAGMLIEFYTVDGVVRDSYFVNGPAGGNPLFVNGHDILNGTALSDYLWGLGGNDTLTGFAGDDMLIGGDGQDLFVFRVGDGRDTIADFVPGAGMVDVLDLRAFGIDSATEFQQVATNQGSYVVVELGGGDRITLLAVQVEQFHNDDFRTDLLLV